MPAQTLLTIIIIPHQRRKVKIKLNISPVFLFSFDIAQDFPLVNIFRVFHLTFPMVAFVKVKNAILTSTLFLAIFCNDFGGFKCFFVANHSIILPFMCGCYPHCSAIALAMPGKVLLAVFASCATPRLPPPPLENAPVFDGKNGL